jgi:hypothetical protein
MTPLTLTPAQEDRAWQISKRLYAAGMPADDALIEASERVTAPLRRAAARKEAARVKRALRDAEEKKLLAADTIACAIARQRGECTGKHHVPGTTTSILSNPSKMPGLSWGLPAGPACPFAVTGEGTICGSCYAQKGRYDFFPVRRAQERRFRWTLECLKSAAGQDEWVSTLIAEISRSRVKYFRVHDSGDLFSPAYTRMWIRVCAALPDVAFWFPTRSYRGPWLSLIVELAALDNVIIRPSALRFDDPAPVVPGLSAGSTATSTGFNCPASSQGNACGACRACWTEHDTPISYHKH